MLKDSSVGASTSTGGGGAEAKSLNQRLEQAEQRAHDAERLAHVWLWVGVVGVCAQCACVAFRSRQQ